MPSKKGGGRRAGNPCPEDTASLLSRALFLWNDELIRKGYERPLQREDVWDINHSLTTELSATELAATGVLEERTGRYLLRGLYRANLRDFWLSGLYRLGQELAQLVQPVLLADILRFLEDESVPLSRGLLSCVLLFAAACAKTLLENHYFITCVRAGIRSRAACVDLVYKKALRLSASARAESSTGQIVNLMQIDAQKFYDGSWGLHMVWAACLQIVGCVLLLFLVLGPSMLAGLFVMVFLVPVNGKLVKLQHQRRWVGIEPRNAFFSHHGTISHFDLKADHLPRQARDRDNDRKSSWNKRRCVSPAGSSLPPRQTPGAKTRIFCAIFTKTDQFTKTGSGQTQEKHSKIDLYVVCFSQGDHHQRGAAGDPGGEISRLGGSLCGPNLKQ